jgi:hypothetical protein
MPPQQRNQWLLQRSTEQRPRILTQDEAQAVGLSPGTVATIGPNGLTVVQAGQQDQQRQQALSATSSLRGELANTQAYKDWQNVSPRVQAMRQAVDIDNQAADMDMIFAWANIIDPGSVVRSEEGRLIARTGGPVEGLRGYINSLNGGARLTPEVRQQLMRQAESRLATYEDPFRQQVNRYRRLAERAGFDPDLIHDAIPEQRQSRYQRPQDAQPEPPRPEQGQTLPVPGGNPVAFVQGLREAVRNRQATAQQAQEIMRRHGLDPSLFNVGG